MSDGRVEIDATLDESDVQRSVANIKADLESIGSSTDGFADVEAAADDMAATVGDATGSMAADAKGAGGEIASGVEGGFDKGTAAAEAFGQVAADVFEKAVDALGDFVSDAAEASDSMNKMQTSLSFAGLDDSTIQQYMASAKKYADETVYDLGDITGTVTKLGANGVAGADSLTAAMGNLNAAAGGDANTFGTFGQVLTQTVGAGKLTYENWRQLTDAVPGVTGVLQTALQDAGAYTGDFQEAMANGEITADEFNQALLALGDPTTEMGAKAEEAATSTDTFEGSVGNLEAALQGDLMAVLDELKPLLTDTINAATTAVEAAAPALESFFGFLADHADLVRTVAVAVGVLAGALLGLFVFNQVTAMVGGFVAALQMAGGGFAGFAAILGANPMFLLVAGIAAAVAALVYFFTQTETGQQLWGQFTAFLQTAFQGFVAFVSPAIEVVKAAISGIGTVLQAVGAVVGAWVSLVVAYWSTVFATISSVCTSIAATVSAVWRGIVSAVTGFVSGIVSGISGGFSGLVGIVTGIFNGIKSAIMTPINAAKSAVKTAVNAIKGAFSFSWHLPKLELPHISVSGGKAPFGIGGMGSLPKFSIKWYAKGGYADGASLIGLGEAGGEGIVPLEGRHMYPLADAMVERMGGAVDTSAIVAWLDRNLGPTIRSYAPTATPRQFNRMVRGA